MSRELDAMQFVLDLLTDGIITSSVQQIGFTPHDKISEPELPFVQVYSPVDENTEQAKRQPPGVLTFQLDILDVFGNSNVLRDAIAALDDTFRIDDTFHGLVQDAFITLRSVAERKQDERSVVGAVVTVQIAEGFPEPDRVRVLLFDDESLFSVSAGALKENSQYINGVVGLQKIATEVETALAASNFTGYPGLPMDLSVTNRLRLLVYMDTQAAVRGPIPLLRLHTDPGVSFSNYIASNRGGHGWLFPSFDLNDPQANVGGGVDLSNVVTIEIRFNWSFFASQTTPNFGILVADLGYTQRDTGDNAGRGYDPGF
jgi:hypothetical protein